jgi:hypothetical protein
VCTKIFNPEKQEVAGRIEALVEEIFGGERRQ